MSTTTADLEPRRPRRLDRQQRVVDRAEPGRGGDRQRQPEVDREVADQVAGGERHEQAADALADQGVGARGGRAAAARSALRVDLLAGQRRRQVRGGGGPVAVGGDLLVALRRSRRRGAAARGRARRGSSRPVTAGLKTATVAPAAARVAGDRRGDDGLADLGPGAGDEDALHGRR